MFILESHHGPTMSICSNDNTTYPAPVPVPAPAPAPAPISVSTPSKIVSIGKSVSRNQIIWRCPGCSGENYIWFSECQVCQDRNEQQYIFNIDDMYNDNEIYNDDATNINIQHQILEQEQKIMTEIQEIGLIIAGYCRRIENFE